MKKTKRLTLTLPEETWASLKMSMAEKAILALLLKAQGTPVTMSHIAGALGLTVPGVHKCLKALRTKGAVEWGVAEGERVNRYQVTV